MDFYKIVYQFLELSQLIVGQPSNKFHARMQTFILGTPFPHTHFSIFSRKK